MKIRGLIIAAFVLFVLASFLYWSEHRKPAGDNTKISADSPPAILQLDQAAITSLGLKQKDAEPIRLAKAASGEWQITEPKPLRADQNTVSTMLSTVSSLNSERLVEDKASNLKAYGLEQPVLEVEINGKGNKSQKLLIGDDTPASGGVYVMLAGDPRIFTMSSYNKTNLDKNLNDLRDKRLLTVNSEKISRVELIRKNQDIEFGRNKDEWQILKPKPLRADSTQVGDLVRQLTDAKRDLSDSDTKNATSAFAHATPFATAKVTDESGSQELQVRKSKDTYYAKSSAVEGECKVDANLAKALDKGLDDFRNKKLFDFGYSDPNKIEVHNGAKAYFLTRGSAGSEDWWSNGKKMDSESVGSLISKLRDLSASKFPESGFSSPAIEAAVTSDDGKRTEKILISKSGDHYLARRESEPTLYQLDASSIDALLKAADEIKPSTAGGAVAPKRP
jgi:hypothetical protein